MGIGRTQEESWTKAAPSASHVSMQRAHVIMLRPQMYGRRKVTATTIIPDANLTSLPRRRRIVLYVYNYATSDPQIIPYPLNVVTKVRQKKNLLSINSILCNLILGRYQKRHEWTVTPNIKIINFSLTVSQNWQFMEVSYTRHVF